MNDGAAAFDAAVQALAAGQPIVIPTDTVYGLAVLAGDPVALDALFALKRRPKDRSIAVLVADFDQARSVGTFNPRAAAVARALWPGALTLVVPRADGVDASVGRADGTVGIRCADHPLVRALARRVGPLATTSANLSGQPTPANAVDAAAALDGEVTVVIDGGECGPLASTVARIEADGEITVFRSGAVALETLAAVQ